METTREQINEKINEKIIESSTTSILIELIGQEAVEKISEAFGGEVIYIPKKIREGRNETIKTDFELMLSDGSTCMSCYRELAKKYDLGERTIMRIVRS